DGRLAAPGLPHDAQRFAAPHGERDAVHRSHLAHAPQQHAAEDGKPHVEILYVEDDVGHGLWVCRVSYVLPGLKTRPTYVFDRYVGRIFRSATRPKDPAYVRLR